MFELIPDGVFKRPRPMAMDHGHHLGAAIGLGYVPCAGESADDLARSDWAVEIAGSRVAAEASLRPLYDPKSERVRM